MNKNVDWKGKLSEGTTQFAAGVTKLQAASEDHGQGGTGDDAQLPPL